MQYLHIKNWKDEQNRRWYLTTADDYPYLSSSSVVAIAKSYRYKDMPRDPKGKARLQQAADKGTDIHSVLEEYNRNMLFLPHEGRAAFAIDEKLKARYNQILLNYIDLVKLISLNEGEVRVIEIERPCINPIFKYAGRFDLLVTVGGEYEIWDYKTSRSIHEEDGWQLVSYMEALKLEGIPVKRVRIIHIDKITSKITDLKYQHHGYMFNKFLSCIEIFKGLYFNDLLKGRINDLEELGKKYKWPLNELTKNYVIDYNLSKGENNMELTEVKGFSGEGGSGSKFTKDPNKVSFPEGEPVMGVVLGTTIKRVIHKGDKGQIFICPGKATCDRCKLGMPSQVDFKVNFLTVDEGDKAVIKKIESNSWGLFFAIKEALEGIQASGGDTKTAVLSITRSGKAKTTKYNIVNVAPKHKAFKDIAATIAPLTAFELSFDTGKEVAPASKPVDRSDIVEK